MFRSYIVKQLYLLTCRIVLNKTNKTIYMEQAIC